MTNKIEISIIIPAYNSQKYVTYVIDRVAELLKREKVEFEVIVVCDGCTDATQKFAENAAKKHQGDVRVFAYTKNRGKGFAVRYGMTRARGNILGFIDCDKEIDAKSINKLLEVFYKKNADIVVGSKRHKDSKVVYPVLRRLISLSYYFLVRLLFNLRVSDTQAGIKIYKSQVFKKIKSQLSIDGFAFDIEMLALARKSGFTKLFEAPIYVNLGHLNDASILKSFRIIKESLYMFWDTLRLFFRMRSI